MVTKTGKTTEEQELERQMEAASAVVQATIGRMLHDRDIHPHVVVLSMAKVTGELMGALAAASGHDVEEVLRDTTEIVHQACRNYYDAISMAMPVAGNA